MNNVEIAPSVAQHYDLPLDIFRKSYPNKRLVIGAAIFSPSSDTDPRPKILLLQRHALEDVYPLMYEIPGGGAEDSDESILATIYREVKEETNLEVNRVLAEFEGFEYTTRTGPSVQFNFLVEVSGEHKVKLNPDEHQGFVWVGMDDPLDKFPMTESMKKVVSDAFCGLESLNNNA